jgi:hypothetical protein
VIFEVVRTSATEPPCEEAVRTWAPVWDVRTSRSPEEHDALMAERWHEPPPPWLSVGTEHCVMDRGIARRMRDREAWVIDLRTLDALLDFVGRYGDVVIDRRFRSLPRIEIYDDYRE